MGDESNLWMKYQISSIERIKESNLYEGIKDAGKNQGDKLITYGTIKNPNLNASSEFLTSEVSYLPNTGKTSPPSTVETSTHNTSENPNTNENQPPNSANISEESNTTVNIAELSDINLNEIPEIKIKNENYFKSGGKISDFLKDKNKFNDKIFNYCGNCNINGHNAFYCKKCEKNLCQQCKDNNERCHNEVINLLEKDKESNKVKEDINNIIYNLSFKLEQEKPEEKSDKIYDIKDFNIDMNKRIIDESIDNFKEKNDFKLIKRIIKENYINYMHYQNILECKNYLENRYQKCYGKSCLIINYNTKGIKRGSKIQIFGDYFVENNKDYFSLIINNKDSELTSTTTLEDNYLEVILVKESENKIKTLSCMFKGCFLLKNFEEYKGHDLIDFNDVEDIRSMFEKCTQLKELNLFLFGSFGKKKLKSMICAFSECNNLETIKGIGQWNTKNVESMASMFNKCLSLTNVEGIQNFDTQNVTDFSKMFCRCEKLIRIPDISKWNMEKAKKLNGMFQECKSLVELPNISKWNIKNVITIERMFSRCSALKTLPIFSQWDMSNVENIEEMFRGCEALTNFPNYLKWKNLKNTVMTTGIFDDCSNYKN